jgi:hypothetical protein
MATKDTSRRDSLRWWLADEDDSDSALPRPTGTHCKLSIPPASGPVKQAIRSPLERPGGDDATLDDDEEEFPTPASMIIFSRKLETVSSVGVILFLIRKLSALSRV